VQVTVAEISTCSKWDLVVVVVVVVVNVVAFVFILCRFLMDCFPIVRKVKNKTEISYYHHHYYYHYYYYY
jgi:hypothetical protein